MYFINPQYHSPKSISNAIDLADIYEVQYYIGENSPLDNGYNPSYEYMFSKKYLKENIDGVNLILYGRKFDIVVLIDKKLCHSVINCIYSYIFKRNLLDDELYFSKPKVGIKSFIINILNKQKNVYGSEKVYREKK